MATTTSSTRRTRPGPPADDAALIHFERSLAKVLRLLVDRSTTGDIARRSGHDLPAASWALLEYLNAQGPTRVSDIAARHGVDVSSVTPRLQRLEQAGLVSREHLPTDARVWLISITQRGIDALERIHAARRELITQELANVGEAEIELASDVLDRVAACLSHTTAHTPPASAGDREA